MPQEKQLCMLLDLMKLLKIYSHNIMHAQNDSADLPVGYGTQAAAPRLRYTTGFYSPVIFATKKPSLE